MLKKKLNRKSLFHFNKKTLLKICCALGGTIYEPTKSYLVNQHQFYLVLNFQASFMISRSVFEE